MNSKPKNHYELLNLEKDATAEEIKNAYREIARIYHPDSNFFKDIIDDTLPPAALEVFKKITAAYQVLSDPARRAEYDETLPKPLPDWETPTEKVSTKFAGSNFAAARPGRDFKNRTFGATQPEMDPSAATAFDAVIQPRPGILKRLKRFLGL